MQGICNGRNGDFINSGNKCEDNDDIKEIEGIGFDFPGQIDYKNGIVKLAPNIPGWINVPIAKIIEDEFHVPTRIDNDVRCAALGELAFGAGKGCQNLICITVGTGIGSGLIINGSIICESRSTKYL